MKYYVAPLEGITGFVYRNCVNSIFGESIDKYFSPFIQPHTKRGMTKRELRDIIPDNNAGIELVPQILTNDIEGFSMLADMMIDMGYKEININCGCPSRTVTSKGRGAALLEYYEELDAFLYNVFSLGKPVEYSVKTRIGYKNADDFAEIINVYNKYQIKELTIHPRIAAENYSGHVHLDEFKYALENSKNPVIYNGDINTVEDYKNLIDEIGSIAAGKAATENCGMPAADELNHSAEEAGKGEPAKLSGIMIGRGMIANPGLLREIRTGQPVTAEELKAYARGMFEGYDAIIDDKRFVLEKIKEVWVYLGRMYPDRKKEIKKLFKSKDFAEYKSAVEAICCGRE